MRRTFHLGLLLILLGLAVSGCGHGQSGHRLAFPYPHRPGCGANVGPTYRSASKNWPPAAWLPFACSSPWNTQLPAFGSATLEPNSANTMNFVSLYFGQPFGPGGTGSTWSISNNCTTPCAPSNDTPTNWSHPVYWAAPTDPTYTVTTNQFACAAGTSATYCTTTGIQIPNGAYTASASAGDDWITVVQPPGSTVCGGIPSNDCEFDAWHVGSWCTAAHANCPFTTLSGAQTFPEAVITATSVTNWPTTNTTVLSVAGVTGNVTCTGISGSTFTGCTGGTGSAATGANVTTAKPQTCSSSPCNLITDDYGELHMSASGCCGGSTAANNGLIDGMVRAPELAAAVAQCSGVPTTCPSLNHALAVSIACTSNANGVGYVAPATGAATSCTMPTATAAASQTFPRATFTLTAAPTLFNNGINRLSISGVTGTVTCTGTSASTFTGCTGGTGTASTTAGAVVLVNDAPYDGARFQLKMSDATISSQSITNWQKVIYETLAKYGIYVIDTESCSPLNTCATGTGGELYWEPPVDYTAFGDKTRTLMAFLASAAGGSLADPASISVPIPWSNFQIVSCSYSGGVGGGCP